MLACLCLPVDNLAIWPVGRPLLSACTLARSFSFESAAFSIPQPYDLASTLVLPCLALFHLAEIDFSRCRLKSSSFGNPLPRSLSPVNSGS